MTDESAGWRTFRAHIPISFGTPPGVGDYVIKEVFAGEYESGYTGTQLTVVDIGANIGAFSLWAAHRWPGCTIEAYEPNPEAFLLLKRSTQRYPMISCYNVAVYPSDKGEEEFFFRNSSDGEAGLLKELVNTFRSESMIEGKRIWVPTLHPRMLPRADVIKIDVEGAEASIVTNADMSNASLIVLEFQNRQNYDAIRAYLDREFEIAFERRQPWTAILSNDAYRPSLAGDQYGTVFFVRRNQTRLWRQPPANGAHSSPQTSSNPRQRVSRRLKRLLRQLRILLSPKA